MKKWTMEVEGIVWFNIEVEAETEEEAHDIGYEKVLTELEGSSDFELSHSEVFEQE